MKRYARWAASAAAWLALAGCSSDGENAESTDALRAGADAIHATGAPGVLVQRMTDRGSRYARSGVADRASQAAIAENARFRMGSVTKTFVATVALQLVGEGRLSLDDAVERWLPGVVAGNGNDGTAITVRHLLQQTSGLYDFRNDLSPSDTPEAYEHHRYESHRMADLIALAMRHPPNFAPGAHWEYCNTNYFLMGWIIEKATGRSWSDEVRARILEPLGLAHTSVPPSPALPEPFIAGYEQFEKDGAWIDVTLRHPSAAGPAGSLVSTTDDIHRFFRALFGGKLLLPAQMDAMKETVAAAGHDQVWPGARYGLGIFWFPLSCGGGYWNHIGDTMGYMTRTGITEGGDRSVVVAMSSQRFVSMDALLRQNAASTELIDRALCSSEP